MNKDKLLKDLFSGVMLGIVLWCIMFGVSLVINVDTDRLLPVFLIVLVAGGLGYVVIKALGDQKKANEMLSLLNSGQYEAYLSRMESYLKKDSSSALSGLLRVNGSVAYIKLGRFEEAIACLNEVKNQKLLGKQVNLVYAINMCMALLGAGKVQEATELFEQSEDLLKQFREDVQYREAINSLYYEFERLKTNQ